MLRSPDFRRRRSATRPAITFPNAPAIVASAGITLGERTGWFGALRWRYLGVAPAHRGQRVSLAADQHLQRPGRLSLRQRLAHPARRAQSAQQQDQPDHLRLRLAAQDRQPVSRSAFLCRWRRRRGRMPERRDGPRAASGRTAYRQGHSGRCFLIALNRFEAFAAQILAANSAITAVQAELTKRSKEILNLSGKRGRLLHGSEMSALFHLGPALNVCVGFFCDRTRRNDYFLRKRGITRWNRDRMIGRDRQAGVQAAIVGPERGADRPGEPVQRDIGE